MANWTNGNMILLLLVWEHSLVVLMLTVVQLQLATKLLIYLVSLQKLTTHLASKKTAKALTHWVCTKIKPKAFMV